MATNRGSGYAPSWGLPLMMMMMMMSTWLMLVVGVLIGVTFSELIVCCLFHAEMAAPGVCSLRRWRVDVFR